MGVATTRIGADAPMDHTSMMGQRPPPYPTTTTSSTCRHLPSDKGRMRMREDGKEGERHDGGEGLGDVKTPRECQVSTHAHFEGVECGYTEPRRPRCWHPPGMRMAARRLLFTRSQPSLSASVRNDIKLIPDGEGTHH